MVKWAVDLACLIYLNVTNPSVRSIETLRSLEHSLKHSSPFLKPVWAMDRGNGKGNSFHCFRVVGPQIYTSG